MEKGKPKVTIIPQTKKSVYRIGIYCRISTKSDDQIKSLVNQVSFLTQKVANTPEWLLVDVYLDIQSGSDANARSEYKRMLSDAKAGKIDIVLTKSVSRFARNTTDALTAIQELHDCGIAIHFDEENLQTDNASHRIIITTHEAVAEAENENRSRSIRWGIKQKARNGTSSLFDRKCYGYMNGETGALEIDPEQAPIVELIFKLYLQGRSILGIIKELERRGIKSPTGKDRWCKHTIEFMLGNEKYYGDVVLFKSYNDGYPKKRRIKNNSGVREKLIAEHDHESIISRSMFTAVQAEKARRSNVIQDGSDVRRKDTRYSSKSAVQKNE